MKLVTKLTLWFMLVACLLVSASAFLRVRREVRVFHEDLGLDHRRLGHALARAASAVRQTNGAEAAHAFIREADDERDDTLLVRWVCDETGKSASPHVSCAELARLDPDGERTHIAPDATGQSRFYTWVRLTDAAAGAIEVSEPDQTEADHTRRVLTDAATSALMLALAFAASTWVLGTWLVGRPTGHLMALARRIGSGELDAQAKISSHDELGALATEMNMMAGRLSAATTRAAEESAARITTLEQLRHADRLTTIGKLASGIAHELGAPINVIEVRASLIANEQVVGEKVIESGRAIVVAADRMTRTIGQLLAFARRGTLERARTDLARIARQTVELVGPLLAKGRVELALDATEGAFANVDELQMQQALTNLVMNAVQAMPDGGRVGISIERVDSAAPPDGTTSVGPLVRIRVEDEGAGIAPGDLPRLFEPFFTTKDVGEGTGLGLSITERIVRDHHGWIAVESRSGGGTFFDVFLPAEPPS